MQLLSLAAYARQITFMVKYGIRTMEDLTAKKEETKALLRVANRRLSEGIGDRELLLAFRRNLLKRIRLCDGIAKDNLSTNTSSNTIVKELVWQADEGRKKELDCLIEGGVIEKKIHEDINYGDIHESDDNLWNFLFFTGHLKKVSERKEGVNVYVTMRIPNLEIASIYQNQIRGWFDKIVKNTDRTVFYRAVLDGNTEEMEDFLSGLLEKTISTFDSSESFYHGFFLSLLYGVPGYDPKSNRERGIGRPDIVLEPRRPRNPALIFEIKVRKKFTEMQGGIREAFDQIRDRRYEEGVLNDGFFGVKSYGVCFCRKSCFIGKYDDS